MDTSKEHLKVVIVGHVDHGKSTIVGRLLADTGTLPEGKLEAIKEQCRKNSRPFEYAFLLDALKNEQNQGITIDMARCFFKTDKRNYIIIDAPGHIEFLKNMVTGAAKAEAALLTIDANEGIQENSKRHGYMLSMLGVKQVAVLINKFDLVDYNREVYDRIVRDYSAFLENLGVKAGSYIPVSGREGDNIATKSARTPWYEGATVLEQMDLFHRPVSLVDKPFRMPVQDVYKFTADNDDRRIIAGTIESGTVHKGDPIVFYPSGKESVVKSIEGFNIPGVDTIEAPHATGVTLTTQIYVRAGEIMARKHESQPGIASRFKVSLFWLGKKPMVKGKKYKLKIASNRVMCELVDVINVLDASDLDSITQRDEINRHDVGECILETSKPIAYDLVTNHEGTGRFVLVDDFDIAGGGIILEKAEETGSILEQHIAEREFAWDSGFVSGKDRTARNHHRGKFVVFTGPSGTGKRDLAKKLEQHLFNLHMSTYYLGVGNVLEGLDADVASNLFNREEHIRRLGELARIMTDAGLIFITALGDIDDYDLEKLKLLNSPYELLVVNVGDNQFDKFSVDLEILPETDTAQSVDKVLQLLSGHNIIPDYCI